MPPYNSSDPNASFLSSSCLDFLLIELVPLARRVAHDRDALPAADASAGAAASLAGGAAPSSVVAGSAAGSMPPRIEDDEEQAAVHYRLDMQGYRVGQGLVERFVTCMMLVLFLEALEADWVAGSLATGLASTTRSTSSSSSAKTSGPSSLARTSTT